MSIVFLTLFETFTYEDDQLLNNLIIHHQSINLNFIDFVAFFLLIIRNFNYFLHYCS